MHDDVRRLSEALARDPGSLAFIPLGEALRRQGQLDVAMKVAVRGLERHPHNTDAHDLLARIHVDRGDLERAFDEWDMVLRFAPTHAGALKGMGFVRFQQGNLFEAERYLGDAHAADPSDASIAAALAHVRERQGIGEAPRVSPQLTPRSSAVVADASGARPRTSVLTPSAGIPPAAATARTLFADLVAEGGQAALLLDAEGFVLAGSYVTAGGDDVAQDIGAELSGVSDEATRAMRHLDLGNWTSIVFETEVATVAMAPGPGDGLLLVAADRSTPIGFVRRVLERAGERARAWLGGGS